MAKSLLPNLTRIRGLITHPDPKPRVRVGSGKPAGTGVPADLYRHNKHSWYNNRITQTRLQRLKMRCTADETESKKEFKKEDQKEDHGRDGWVALKTSEQPMYESGKTIWEQRITPSDMAEDREQWRQLLAAYQHLWLKAPARWRPDLTCIDGEA